MQPELIFDLKQELGESPLYDAANSRLIWADILRGAVLVMDEKTGNLKEHQVGKLLANIVLCQNGGFILAMQDGLYYADSNFENLKNLGAPNGYSPDIRFNDGKCDAKGRLFIGTCANEQGAAALYRWTKEDSFTKVLSGVTISNGLVWNKDNKKLYYIDTPLKQVWSFDYDLETGTFKNQTIACDLSDEPGMPDGMCADAEGMLWIAKWNGAMVSRWNPISGEKLMSIDLPVLNVSACAFGGANMSTLYITTAWQGADEKARQLLPLSGGLFKVETNITGAEFHPCKY